MITPAEAPPLASRGERVCIVFANMHQLRAFFDSLPGKDPQVTVTRSNLMARWKSGGWLKGVPASTTPDRIRGLDAAVIYAEGAYYQCSTAFCSEAAHRTWRYTFQRPEWMKP